MKSYTIKLQKPGTKLEKKNQLAWLIANMAAEDAKKVIKESERAAEKAPFKNCMDQIFNFLVNSSSF